MEPTDNNEILFLQMVIQNQQIAMMSMGRINNPVINTIEKNMEYAKLAIDTLDMIAVKTKGNLSEYEDKFLGETIRELKLVYIEETGK